MPRERKLYTITCTKRQLITLEEITYMFAQIIVGNLNEGVMPWVDVALMRHVKDENVRKKLAEDARTMMDFVTQSCWVKMPSGEYEIGYDDTADVLFDMYQVIRKFRYDTLFSDEQRYVFEDTELSKEPAKVGNCELIKIREIKTKTKENEDFQMDDHQD